MAKQDSENTQNLIMKILDRKNIFAVVGVSRNKNKYGYKVYMDLKKGGYKVFAINPNCDFIDNDKCYNSLKELPKKPDVVSVVVPPNISEKIVKEAYELGIKNIWFQPGSESEKSINYCKIHGINVIYNMCIMIKKRSLLR